MPRLRNTYLRKAQALADSGTYVLDITLSEAVSQIELVFSATNGATSNTAERIHDRITSIQLVDGSTVIFSMPGALCKATNFFEDGMVPYGDLTEAAGAVQSESFKLNFGRWLGDTDFFLDPSKYKNLQLRITYSLTISATVGWATGTGSLDVIAKVFADGMGNPKGTIYTKDIYDFTTAASGDVVVQLPRDYPYKMIVTRAYLANNALRSILTNMKLSVNADAYVPLDETVASILRQNVQWRGPFEDSARILAADAATRDVWLSDIQHAEANAIADLDIAHFDAISNGRLTLGLYLLSATPTIAKDATARNINAGFRGYGPWFSIAHPFGDPWTPELWYDPRQLKSFELKLTQGVASAAANVAIQQLCTM